VEGLVQSGPNYIATCVAGRTADCLTAMSTSQEAPGSTVPQDGREVAGLNPDQITEFSNLPNPSSRIMVLGSTRPLTETSASRSFYV
jgi:hypothetical protein